MEQIDIKSIINESDLASCPNQVLKFIILEQHKKVIQLEKENKKYEELLGTLKKLAAKAFDI